MKINARWLGDVVQSVVTVNRMWPKSNRAATNLSKRTEALLERFNASSEDERMDVIRAACCLASFCDFLMREVGYVDVRVEQH